MVLKEYFDNLVKEKERLLNENAILKRALNKACEELASLSHECNMRKASPYAYDCDYTTAEEWKEWAMDNERW